MKVYVLSTMFLLASASTSSAFAQVSPEPEMTATATTESALSPAATLPTVPKLNITWDCGECEHNEKVLPLIEQAYAAEAHRNSFVVSESDVAEVAIINIRQRPPGVRVMFGIMAGKDRLGLRIRYLDEEYMVSDTSANAIMGLNHLSESVGKKAYAELAPKPAKEI